MYEGQIIGIVKRNEATVEQLGLMMAGVPMRDALDTAKPAAEGQPVRLAA